MMTKSMEALTEVGELDRLLEDLFPIARSLTGPGNRETFKILQELIPLEVIEYPSGEQVYDWIIPEEWRVRDAWIKASNGERLVDYETCNLHVMGYSVPIHKKMEFTELAPHLHYLKADPDVIPYRTSYYQRDWGFCITQSLYKQLEAKQGPFEVCIDSELKEDGVMELGELLIPGISSQEYMVSTYCCHPSMANDNLSGLLTTAFLARDLLRNGIPQYSWRFVFLPETIGAIAYLKHNETAMRKLRGALVATTCGGPGPLGYKETFLVNHLVDRAIRLAFRDLAVDPIRYPFAPDGSDERQYSSPGFRIPAASITKDKYYEYPEYHTASDNLSFVNGGQISESLTIYREVIQILENNAQYLSTSPNGEPRLGRRNLYPEVGGGINQSVNEDAMQDKKNIDAMTWILFLSDGEHDLVTISERSGLAFSQLLGAASRLVDAGLISKLAECDV